MNYRYSRMHLSGPTARPLAGNLVLLAPSAKVVPSRFRNIVSDGDFHDHLLGRVQQLRGAVYLRDGAIEERQISEDGRHRQAADDRSWHIVSMHADDQVAGCARYQTYPASVRPEQLGVWASALAKQPGWSLTLRAAVTRQIDDARRRGVSCAEVGGWAVDVPFRFTAEGLTVALSAFALSRALGGCLGLTTATVRNASSRILKKIGGRPVEVGGLALPPYYDPFYRCEMEILGFDSASPQPKYESLIDKLSHDLGDVPVVCAEPHGAEFQPTKHAGHGVDHDDARGGAAEQAWRRASLQ